MLAKLGIQVTCSDIFGAWGTQWLDELPLPQPYCWKVASLRQLISWLSSEINDLDRDRSRGSLHRADVGHQSRLRARLLRKSAGLRLQTCGHSATPDQIPIP